MSKMIFMKYLQPVRPKMFPQFPKCFQKNLWKSDTCNTSSIPIAILMSKIVFKNYLPPARPKLVPKLKMFRIY